MDEIETQAPILSRFEAQTYICSDECQRIHRRCVGCGVLEGPDHFHRLRDGFCAYLVNMDLETGMEEVVPIGWSCWDRMQLERRSGLIQGAA